MRRGAQLGATALALCLGAAAGQAALTTGDAAGRAVAPFGALAVAPVRAPVFADPAAARLGPVDPTAGRSPAPRPPARRPARAPIAVELLGVIAVGPPLDAAAAASPPADAPGRPARGRENPGAGDRRAAPPPRAVRCSALAAEDCYAASWSERLAARAPDAPTAAWLAASPFALFAVGALGWGIVRRMRRAA